MKNLCLPALILIFTFPAFSQAQNTSSLSIKEIMQGEKYVGFLPESPRWSADGNSVIFSWNPDMDTLRSSYSVDLASKKISKLSYEEVKSMPSSRGDFNKDFTKKVYEKNGDLFIMDLSNFAIRQITNTVQLESSPIFSGDDAQIIYRSGNNLFCWKIADGTTTQLTNFKSGTKQRKPKSNAMNSWLEQDQLAYFEILKERNESRESRSYRSNQTKPNRPAEIYIEKKQLVSINISPDLKHVVYMLMKRSSGNGTIVPDYVTQSGYTRDLQARSKVGAAQNEYETWIYNRTSDSAYQVITKDIPGIYDKPAFLQEYEKEDSIWIEAYHDPRKVIALTPKFSDDGKAVFVVRSQDNKDRWIMLLNLDDGSSTLLDQQRDEAWVGGPGISSWNFSSGTLDWLDDNHIYYQSEETGYSHLYRMDVNNGKKKALTDGNFELSEVSLSRDRKTFFITAGVESPHVRHFYHLPAKGGKLKQITNVKGGYDIQISPDEKTLVFRYSSSNSPWELYVMPNEPGAQMTQLTQSTTDQFNNYSWRAPKVISFDAGDGAKVPARIYEPAANKKNGAAVIFVHGAGYLQNVHEWWSSYFREYMFHNFLTDNGYTVLDIDYRASSGYGRDWRTGIYRFMGGKDLSDHIDGAKYLVEEHNIDPERVGIYGGSYGGFITLMAMFTSPGTFKSGAALRSVTDWAHYNHGYTSNILNTPVEDSIAYAKSSPIYFAEGLEGNLLMLHGMVDTNVQFQDVVRLSQRLIELEKENWELAVFPVEGHGFREASSWTDEYRRIYELFEETLR